MVEIVGAGMNFAQLQEYVSTKIPLIKYDPKRLKESLERTTEFLLVIATLNDFRQKCEADLAKIQTITEGFFFNAKEASQGKNITEKKLDAAVNPEYTNARETLEEIESMVKWTRTAIDIFNNAHLTYRQLSRD